MKEENFFLLVRSDSLRVVRRKNQTEEDVLKESIPPYDNTTNWFYHFYSTIHERVAKIVKSYPLSIDWDDKSVSQYPAQYEGYSILIITDWLGIRPDSWVVCWNEESHSLFLVTKDQIGQGSYSLMHCGVHKKVTVRTYNSESEARIELWNSIEKRVLRDELVRQGRHI